jgi:alpha-glucosidase
MVRNGPALVLVALMSAAGVSQVPGEIERVDPPRQGFYGKRIVAEGIPVLAHESVSDAALEEAARRINGQLGRAPEIAANLARLGAELHLIGKDQQTTDLPEYRDMKGKPFEGDATMDERGRGYGGLHASCAEENLLMYPSDRFTDHRDICRHEFAHTIMGYGLSPDLRERIEAQYAASLAAGRWKDTYAATNADEFFAELTMWYFGTRGDYGKLDPAPEPGALWLLRYDPDAYALLDDLYSGRLKPAPVEVVDLPRLPPEAEATTRSQPDQPATTVIFLNLTDQPIERFWLDFEGQRKSYGVIPPGGLASQNTFATHAWLLTGAEGQVLGIWVPEKTVGRIVVGE